MLAKLPLLLVKEHCFRQKHDLIVRTTQKATTEINDVSLSNIDKQLVATTIGVDVWVFEQLSAS